MDDSVWISIQLYLCLTLPSLADVCHANRVRYAFWASGDLIALLIVHWSVPPWDYVKTGGCFTSYPYRFPPVFNCIVPRFFDLSIGFLNFFKKIFWGLTNPLTRVIIMVQWRVWGAKIAPRFCLDKNQKSP